MDDLLDELGVSAVTEQQEERRVIGQRLAETEEVVLCSNFDGLDDGAVLDARKLLHLFPPRAVDKLVELAGDCADPRVALGEAAGSGKSTKDLLRRALCEAACLEQGLDRLSDDDDEPDEAPTQPKMGVMAHKRRAGIYEEKEDTSYRQLKRKEKQKRSWEPLQKMTKCPLCGTDVANVDEHIADGYCRAARTKKQQSQQTQEDDDDDYAEEEDDDDDSEEDDDEEPSARMRVSEQVVDDAEESKFQSRMDALMDEGDLGESDGEEEEDVWLRPSIFEEKLYEHQREGIRWLIDVDGRGVGGIVGDEMGLGKTATTAAFLGALYDQPSRRRRGRKKCILILAPTTMLSHWTREIHRWAPRLRVMVLHRSATAFDRAASGDPATLTTFLAKAIEEPRRSSAKVVLASYDGMHALHEALIAKRWGYVVLDEGQKIRNPTARVTQLCKRVRTSRRLLLSGTPVQNSLKELWSLVDFCCPGLLGTEKHFDAELATPIRRGGYATASPDQVQLAYRCAVALRDVIKPILLRRTKATICRTGNGPTALPPKTEHVLLCRLSRDQINLYQTVLRSTDVRELLAQQHQSYSDQQQQQRGGTRFNVRCFRALTGLRQICNHPDIYGGAPDGEAPGAVSRSAKLQTLDTVLQRWKTQGHRAAIFSQSKKMLDIIEALMTQRRWRYARIDGDTPATARQATADEFNANSKVFCIICTTRTGGVGMSFVGADRVVLYDPDWNPQTDAQARERAWRLGQTRPVTVYRFVCAGTIEEKIYHRQIFKQALTNKILQDPKQRRLFSQSELADLFTLGTAAYPRGPSDHRNLDDVDSAALIDATDVVEPPPQNRDPKTGDEAVLEALWDGSNDGKIATVFSHDALDSADPGLRAHADREAKLAVRALQQQLAPPSVAPRAVSSSSILAQIQRRQNGEDADDSDNSEAGDDAVNLVKRVNTFLQRRKHGVTTSTLLTAFSDVTDAVLFRSVLRQLAVLRNGIWVPKSS